MNSNDFENELKSRAFRKVPEHWREQILAGANQRAEPEETPSPWWRELFWPNPTAWGTLAAAWVLILCFRFAAADTSSQKSAAPPHAPPPAPPPPPRPPPPAPPPPAPPPPAP